MKCCVIGHPLGHSLSPFIHEQLFKISGIKASYSLNDIDPADLVGKIEDLKKLDCFNITIPHKSEIISLLDVLDDNAKTIGAVNTVKNVDGVLYGYNTDGYGFAKALSSAGIPLKGEVLICGYGGAALAMAHEALKAGCNLCVGVNDLQSTKALNFVESLKKVYGKEIKMILIKDIDQNFDLAVNATPVGMFPNSHASILTKQQLTKISTVFDAVYNPYNTKLVTLARELNKTAISGMSMLVWQAAKAHNIWYGANFSTQQIDDICTAAINKLI